MKIALPTKPSLLELFAAERNRFILWSPVGLMFGIAAYFEPESEPPVWLGAVMLGLTLLGLLVFRHRPKRWLLVPFLLFSLGFTAAQTRAHLVATPLLSGELTFREVEGTIDEIEPVEKRVKIVLSQLSIEDLPPAQTPLRVRISFRNDDGDWHVGDRVRLMANLYPLPQPTMPGSYDFARHFYFRSIGGNGFAMKPPELVAKGVRTGVIGSMMDWVNNLRHSIGEDMRAHMPGATGTVAAAMTVGETGPIPTPDKVLLRDAGLAHMLAIAGLHLGIVAGIVFFNARLLLTLWPRLALRLPVKKMAAALALGSAFIYLMLAGRPIPAQRAFIMVAFLFTAVMLDRRGITLRTLSIAAMLILLIFPEAMYGASFQMSFAATLAIVSLFERYGRQMHRGQGFWRKIYSHGMGITTTSLVATLSTAPFVLYNFNRFAIFGLLANMAVIPLATFVIMPGVVLSLLLMPLGLQAIGYLPLRYGTDMMMVMAGWVTGLPYSALHLPAPSDAGLIVASFGLLWLCLMTRRWRILGVPIMALGLMTLTLHVPPDVLVSHDAHQVMVHTPDGHYVMLKGAARSFTAQSWLRAEGQEEAVALDDTDAECSKTLCDYRLGGYRLLVVKKPQDEAALASACHEKADLLIAWRYMSDSDCPGPKQRVGRRELEAHGAHALWLGPQGVRMAYGHELGQDKRLWQVKLANDF